MRSPAITAARGILERVCECLNEFEVDYLIVGSEAVAFHGVPRYSVDFDTFLRATSGRVPREGCTGAIRPAGTRGQHRPGGMGAHGRDAATGRAAFSGLTCSSS